MSDQALVARVVAGDDRHAFATLVRRHQEPVRRLLRRLTGDQALADDLAQETFLRAYKGLAGFVGRAQLASWLYRIAYNVFLSEHGRRQETPVELADVAAEQSERDPMLNLKLERAMAVLRPEERASLTLFFAQGLSAAEIAVVFRVGSADVRCTDAVFAGRVADRVVTHVVGRLREPGLVRLGQ